MRWIDMSEKEMIKAWSNEEYTNVAAETYLPQPDNKEESYWKKFDNEKNITEYDFHSVPELSTLLKTELSDEFFKDLILPLTVAAFREKAKVEHLSVGMNIENNDVLDNMDDELIIPEFVYVF